MCWFWLVSQTEIPLVDYFVLLVSRTEVHLVRSLCCGGVDLYIRWLNAIFMAPTFFVWVLPYP